MKPAEKTDVGAIAGRYRSDTTGTETTISETDDGPRLRTGGRFGSAEFKVECLDDGIWRAKLRSPMPWGGMLLFDDDSVAFRFFNLPTRALPFPACRLPVDRSPS